MKLFSKKDSDSRKNKSQQVLPEVIGAAALGMAYKDNSLIKQHAEDFINSKITAEDSGKIMRSLMKKAEDQGIKVMYDPNLGNSVYTGSGKLANYQRKLLETIKKRYPKIYKKLVGKLEDHVLEDLGKDRVLLGSGTLADVDILSHELGHAQYMKSGRSKNILAKAAHKLMPLSNAAISPLGSAGAFALGARGGYKTEKKRSEGRKTSLWEKAAPVAIPVAAVSPLLIAEGAASLKGLKMMKEAGASKELLKQSKKRLGNAWGTYAAGSLKPLFASGAGGMAGRALAKMQNNKSNDDPSGEKTYSGLNCEELKTFTGHALDRIPLSKYKSSEGILRTIAADSLIPGGGGIYYGRKAGLKAAELADLEGDPDYEIVKKASRAGMKRGAITGAAINASLGAAIGAGIGILDKLQTGKIIKKAIGGTLIGGIGGALFSGIGGRNSARVLVKDKIRQRDEESDRRRKRSK